MAGSLLGLLVEGWKNLACTCRYTHIHTPMHKKVINMQMLHTLLDCRYLPHPCCSVVLANLSKLCSVQQSGLLLAADCSDEESGQNGTELQNPEVSPTDNSWHMGGTERPLKISHCTIHITQERGLHSELWNQQKKKKKKSTNWEHRIIQWCKTWGCVYC